MQLSCPSCQTQLRVPDTAAGKTVKCPRCSNMFPAIDQATAVVPVDPIPRATRRPDPPPILEPMDEEDFPTDRDAVQERAPRRRSRDWDEDEDSREQSPYGGNDDEYMEEARRRGRSAGFWFILAAIVTILLVAFNISSTLIMVPNIVGQRGGMNEAAQAGRFVGVFGCGAVVLLGAIFQFLASGSLRSFKGKGMVITAIVFGFLFGAIFGFGLVTNIVLVRGFQAGLLPANLLPVIYTTIGLGALTTFLNLFSAIKGIVTLNNQDVSRAFRRAI